MLGTHVTDRAFAGGADRARTRADELDDVAGSALDGEHRH